MSDKMKYKEAAEFLGIPVGTLYALVCRRRIPHIRMSARLVRFSKAELESWIRSHSVSGKPDSRNGEQK
jgi:excisionase family DNA binding protein